MLALAEKIAALSLTRPEGPTPDLCSLYRFLVRVHDGDSEAAKAALAQYLSGSVPIRLAAATRAAAMQLGVGKDELRRK
jgi:hypothetical protein